MTGQQAGEKTPTGYNTDSDSENRKERNEKADGWRLVKTRANKK